jgi:hypothetical protein
MRHSLGLIIGLGLSLSACSSDDETTGKSQPTPGNDAGDSGTGGESGSAGDAGTDSGNPEDAGPDSPAPDGSDGATGWQLPNCTSVTGTAAVTFTSDDGATLAPVSGTLSGTVYTKGLVALQVPNTLLAASGPNLLRSEDAGCNWTSVASLPGSVMLLVAGIGDRAYAFQDNDKPLVRIDGTTVTTLKSPVDVIGMATDPSEPDRARVGGSDATVWETTNAGESWTKIGVPAITSTLLLAYRFAFDPKNLDHILFGSATDGAFVSTDGAQSWTKSTGLAPSGKANAFEVLVSPVDSEVAWAEGIDLDENLANAPNEGRHIFRSNDGGLSFERVIDHVPGQVTLTNGLPLVAHPTDKEIIYFEFGASYGGYGTDLFKWDGTTLKKTHNDYDDMHAIAFSPADPNLLYLGITQEQIQ